MKKTRLSKIKKGEKKFESRGMSELKITKSNNGINQIECIEIPIVSTGITEIIDTFKSKAPTPPVINELVSPDSEIGKQLGITKKEWIKMPNYADSTYLEERQDYESKLGIAIVVKGIDIEFENENDEVITNDDQKVEILQENGLTGEHFSKLVDDITSLTKWTDEEKERFFA